MWRTYSLSFDNLLHVDHMLVTVCRYSNRLPPHYIRQHSFKHPGREMYCASKVSQELNNIPGWGLNTEPGSKDLRTFLLLKPLN